MLKNYYGSRLFDVHTLPLMAAHSFSASFGCHLLNSLPLAKNVRCPSVFVPSLTGVYIILISYDISCLILVGGRGFFFRDIVLLARKVHASE